jgi:Holliday junction resolvasome RuvABC endonuclease subunit
MPDTNPIILGLDPGTRFLGAALVQGRRLLAYGVHELKNGEKPYDVIGQARRVVLRYIATHAPQVVAIEAPYLIATKKRSAVLSAIAQELHARATELGLKVVELSPEEVRRAVTGNERATKIDVAEALVARGFDELRTLVPKPPARSGLGLRPRDRYWLHAFDALALAVACMKSIAQPTSSHPRTLRPVQSPSSP